MREWQQMAKDLGVPIVENERLKEARIQRALKEVEAEFGPG